jgi:S-adenosylmethionine:tRNA ribosyltransferase-isomerase
MIAAAVRPVRRPAQAKLLIADAYGHLNHAARHVIDVLRPGDLVIANDAATLPASL